MLAALITPSGEPAVGSSFLAGLTLASLHKVATNILVVGTVGQGLPLGHCLVGWYDMSVLVCGLV